MFDEVSNNKDTGAFSENEWCFASHSVISTEINVFTVCVATLVLCVLLQHWIIGAVACSGSGELLGRFEFLTWHFKLRFGPLATALLSRALVGLELDELLGHVVVVALGEDAQDGQSRLIHVDAFTQRQPAGGAALRGHVLQLKDSHAHGAVLSSKAVVLHAHLQLVALRTHLITQGAAEWGDGEYYKNLSKQSLKSSMHINHLQSEGLVVFGSPAVVLWLRGVLPLFVTEVRADDIDFHKRPEYSLRLPPQVICSDHWNRQKDRAKGRKESGKVWVTVRFVWRKCVKKWSGKRGRVNRKLRQYWLSLRPHIQFMVKIMKIELEEYSLQNHIFLWQMKARAIFWCPVMAIQSCPRGLAMFKC